MLGASVPFGLRGDDKAGGVKNHEKASHNLNAVHSSSHYLEALHMVLQAAHTT